MGDSLSIEGIVPILPTPFTDNYEVDIPSLARLVDFAIEAGVAAVGTPAFGSEYYKLDGAERNRVVETVIARAEGRIPVIIQCNHPSPRVAARIAAEAANMGASAINIALPRSFEISPRHLVEFARAVCDAVGLSVVVQDWNPSGPSVGAPFAVELRRHCRNFRYLKLEQARIAPVIRAVELETDGAVKVFAGWGGLYALEFQAAGACGVMPGLALADVFVRIWQFGKTEDWNEALTLFAAIAPYLQFSLQTFEQFHHAEKRLLVARGLLNNPVVRPPSVDIDEDAQQYLSRLLMHLTPWLQTH